MRKMTVSKNLQSILFSMGMLFLVGTPAFCQDQTQTPLAIAHGNQAHVARFPGSFVHRWTGEDGQAFEILDHNPNGPTAEERRNIEASFQKRSAELSSSEAKLRAAASRLNSCREQMDKVREILKSY
ncbi:MAG: hypothetical protein IRZ03_16475 [Acidobacterium ailaaui]|jgi:hypothetical protein|nr:hypothetical protein [Pseudacidobacterium ailaaui]